MSQNQQESPSNYFSVGHSEKKETEMDGEQ